MSNENGKQAPSADEIIEALALEMGVDDQSSGDRAAVSDDEETTVRAEPPRTLAERLDAERANDASRDAVIATEPSRNFMDDDEEPTVVDFRPDAPVERNPRPPVPAAASAAGSAPHRAAPSGATPVVSGGVGATVTPASRPAARTPAVEIAEALEMEAAMDSIIGHGPEPEPEPDLSHHHHARPAIHARNVRRGVDPSRAERNSHERALRILFSVGGKKKDPYLDAYYDEPDEVSFGRGRRLFIKIALLLSVSAAGLMMTFLALPDQYRQDIVPLLSGENIHEQRRLRREAEEERRHRAWLESLPKHGELVVRSTPGAALVRFDADPFYFPHPSREGWLVQSRSPAQYTNLLVDQHHVVTITLPNHQERRIDLFPYGNDASLWVQHPLSGEYACELNEFLDADLELAAELTARLYPTPDQIERPPELLGMITVQTEPLGATVTYNGRLLADEEGNPLTTPLTFSQYPPPPHEGTGEPAEPLVPVPVSLRNTGAPLLVELEGYMPVALGVHAHQYTCDLREGVAEDAWFWEVCEYTYNTGIVELMRPTDYHLPGREVVAAGSGEGTGTGGVETTTVNDETTPE